MKYEFKIKQDGIWVVTGYAASLDIALIELARYLATYQQDGPIDSVVIKRKENSYEKKILKNAGRSY